MIEIKTVGSSSSGNAYILRSNARSLLLECGVAWPSIQRETNFRTAALDGCLISHGHGDHCKSAKNALKAGVDIWATEETFSQIGLEGHRNYRCKKVTPNRRFMIAGYWTVHPFDTEHDCPGSVGFVISDQDDRLAFITDTGFVRYKIPDVTILMIEANFSEAILAENIQSERVHPAVGKRIREKHMSVERVLDFLKANDTSRLREIRLLHLSDGNSNAELFKATIQKATGIPTMVEG